MSDTKRCTKCGETKPRSVFKKNGSYGWCPSCNAADCKRDDAVRRFKAITLLGGHCVVCHTTNQLEIDHINNDGDVARGSRRGAGRHTIVEVFRYHAEHGLAATLLRFQLLCKPCHAIKTWHAWKGIPWPKIETAPC